MMWNSLSRPQDEVKAVVTIPAFLYNVPFKETIKAMCWLSNAIFARFDLKDLADHLDSLDAVRSAHVTALSMTCVT